MILNRKEAPVHKWFKNMNFSKIIFKNHSVGNEYSIYPPLIVITIQLSKYLNCLKLYDKTRIAWLFIQNNKCPVDEEHLIENIYIRFCSNET